MANETSQLVLVAHPNDETLGFSSVCAGADVVSVTDGGSQGRAEEFRHACQLLGAKRALSLNLPDVSPWRLPVEMLAGKFKELGSYSRVYTHSPLEQHPHHQDVAFAASKCFEEIWVRTCGGYVAQAHVLAEHALRQKLDIINNIYRRETAPTADNHFTVAEITGVEAFAPARLSEVIQALALTTPEISWHFPNVWAYEVSPYEIERYDRTCEVLAQVSREWSPTSILELGACEGAMTLRLRRLFPGAKLRAVEADPAFACRLRERLSHDANIDVVEASILDIPLSADIVVVAEMLYYVPQHIMDIFGRMQAQYLLTSYTGSFDDRICRGLHHFGWRNIASVQVLPRFEPVDGRSSFLLARRPGSHIRLWKLVGHQTARFAPLQSRNERHPL
jgi:LmbE family N-acetylglucosaminyl deacetylase